MVHLTPTNVTLTSQGLARLYLDHVWKLHGMPKKVISDRGPQFASEFMKELHNILGVESALSTAHHPQTDGQTERVNQDVEQYLRTFCHHDQDDWVDLLSVAEYAYNNRVHSATGFSPFFMNYGRHPWASFEPARGSHVESVNVFADRMKSTFDIAQKSLQQASDDMKRYADAHRRDSPKYQVGDMVWLEGTYITTVRPSKKLDDRRYGPFKIVKIISPTAYRLDLPPRWTIHPVVHVSLLRPHRTDRVVHPDPHTRPPPDIINGEQEWEVDRLLDCRRQGRGFSYLVLYKGYPVEEAQWRPAGEVKVTAPRAILDFHRTHPNKPLPGSIIRHSLAVEGSP